MACAGESHGWSDGLERSHEHRDLHFRLRHPGTAGAAGGSAPRGWGRAMIQITHRYTGRPLYTSETASSLREAVVQAVVEGANLAGADLADAYLAGAHLAGANLAGADLADAYLAD